MTPSELAIYGATQSVEALGVDERLTDAVNLLQAARESVADFMDGTATIRRYVRAEANPETVVMSCDTCRFNNKGRCNVVLHHCYVMGDLCGRWQRRAVAGEGTPEGGAR
jgi:hypothetical protein